MPDPHQRPRFTEGRAVIGTIRSWPADLKRLLIDADDAGCKLRKTRNGHVVVSNDYGGSTTVAGKSVGRSKTHTAYRQGLRSVIDEQLQQKSTQPESRAIPTEPVVTGASGHRLGDTSFIPDTEDLEIDVPVVPKFVICQTCKPPSMHRTEEERDLHRAEMHFQCPDCGDWIKSKGGYGGHKAIKHGASKPWESRRYAKAKEPTAEARSDAPSNTMTLPEAQAAGLAGLTQDEAEELRGASPLGPRRSLKKAVAPRGPVAHDKQKRLRPVQDHELPDPSVLGAVLNEANKLDQIRTILGADPRIAKLESDLETMTKRAEDAETKLAMARDHLRGAQEVFDL